MQLIRRLMIPSNTQIIHVYAKTHSRNSQYSCRFSFLTTELKIPSPHIDKEQTTVPLSLERI